MTYRVGVPSDVAWIREPTACGGLTITAAIPPVFAKYATVVVPDDDASRREHDERIVNALRQESSEPAWWFGFLDTGSADPLPEADAPRVRLYAGWEYIVIQGSPDEALRFRPRESDRTLPDLMFPSDRTWLVSTLWDDEWRCVGGSTTLIDALAEDPGLETREVALGVDATPPGHVAY